MSYVIFIIVKTNGFWRLNAIYQPRLFDTLPFLMLVGRSIVCCQKLLLYNFYNSRLHDCISRSRIAALLGPQIALVHKALVNIAPSFAMRSMLGVGANSFINSSISRYSISCVIIRKDEYDVRCFFCTELILTVTS